MLNHWNLCSSRSRSSSRRTSHQRWVNRVSAAPAGHSGQKFIEKMRGWISEEGCPAILPIKNAFSAKQKRVKVWLN